MAATHPSHGGRWGCLIRSSQASIGGQAYSQYYRLNWLSYRVTERRSMQANVCKQLRAAIYNVLGLAHPDPHSSLTIHAKPHPALPCSESVSYSIPLPQPNSAVFPMRYCCRSLPKLPSGQNAADPPSAGNPLLRQSVNIDISDCKGNEAFALSI